MHNNDIKEDEVIDPVFERMLKTFIKQTEKLGILQEAKERKNYTKPSEVKRLEENRRRKENKSSKNQKRRKNK